MYHQDHMITELSCISNLFFKNSPEYGDLEIKASLGFPYDSKIAISNKLSSSSFVYESQSPNSAEDCYDSTLSDLILGICIGKTKLREITEEDKI